VTSSPYKALGLMDKPGAGLFTREQLTLGVGELVYGLGERFSAFAKNGQTIDMWNADCGTCSDKGYKDVPFFLTSKGYGVLVNSPDKISFEIGTEQVMRAQFAAPGEDLDYFFIYGPRPKDVLLRLGALAGRPALPPVWSFGLWLTTSFTTDYDEHTITEHIEGMRKRELPLHVFHFDCFWMKGHHWCNFEWDESVFPEPQAMLARLKERGLAICVWINPYIAERSRLFDEGLAHGYLLKRPNGDVYQRPRWQAGMGYVDFTNPDARRWYQEALRRLLRMGVDAFKTDFGEEIPTDVVYHDGSDPERMHNYYTYLYNEAVFELLAEERGENQAVVFARSATMTCQRFPVHWGGDCYATYESMAESLRGGLSLSLCGFGFWSHDIGGFESTAPASVYKRWIGFGLLSSHSRLHGSTSYRVPWLYDEEAVDVLRYFTQLKCRLMPYLMRAALEAHEASLPVMRPMLLEFPDDPQCKTLDRQYMLGDSLLVAPVFHDSRAEYYLPEGEWTQLLTGEVRQGGRWHTEALDFFGMPLFIRQNSLVPLGPELTKVSYDFSQGLRLRCGKLDGKTACNLRVVGEGGKVVTSFALEQNGTHVTITNLDGLGDFELELPWASAVSSLEGAREIEPTPARKRIPLERQGVVLRATAARVSFTR
jgi:alpha-D-xyloside xylohydrolase